MSRKWLMWVGCGAMVLGGIYLLWARGYQNILSYALLLLCPLSHVLMMAGGHKHGGPSNEGHDHDKAGQKPACH